MADPDAESTMKTCPSCGKDTLVEQSGMTFCASCGEFGGPVVDDFIDVLDNNSRIEREKVVDKILTYWARPKDASTADEPTKTVRQYIGVNNMLTVMIDAEENVLHVMAGDLLAKKNTPVSISYEKEENLPSLLQIIVQLQDELTPENVMEKLVGDHGDSAAAA